MATKKATTILQYILDQANFQKVVAANSQIIGGTKQLATAGQVLQRTLAAETQSMKQLASAGQVLAQTLHADAQAADARAAFTGRTLDIEKQITEQNRLQATYLQNRLKFAEQGAIVDLRNSIGRAGGGAGGTGGAGGLSLGQNITRFGRGLFNAPDVGGSTAISRAAIAGGAVIDKLTDKGKAKALPAIAQVGIAAGIAAPAIVLTAIALDRFNKSIDESKKVLTGALSAQQNYYAALADLTSTQAEDQIDELKRNRPILEQQLAETQGSLDSAFEQAQSRFGDLAARLLTAGGKLPTEQLTEERDKQRAALEENIQTEVRLAQGRAAGVFAANDATEAEKTLAQQRLDFAQYFAGITKIDTDEQVRQNQLRVEIDRMTAEQREEKLAQDRAELEIINTRLQQNNLYNNMTIEAEAILRERQGELVESILFTSEVTDTWADGVKRLADNIQHVTDQTDDYFEALKQEEDIRDKMTEIREKEAEIIEDRNVKVLELQADLADKLATAQEGASEKIRDIEEATAEKRQELAENSAEKLFKLQRDAGRDLFDAVADRDALTHSKRSRQFADDLADQQTADQKQSDQLQKQRDKQTEAVSDTLEKQRKIAEKAFDKSTNDLYNTTVKQLNVQRRAYQEQEVALNNTLFNEQQIALYGSGNQRIIHTQMWTDLAGIAAIGVRNVVSAFSGAIGGVFNPSGHSTLSSTYPGGPSSQQVFNQNFDRRLNATINASSGVRGPI